MASSSKDETQEGTMEVFGQGQQEQQGSGSPEYLASETFTIERKNETDDTEQITTMPFKSEVEPEETEGIVHGHTTEFERAGEKGERDQESGKGDEEFDEGDEGSSMEVDEGDNEGHGQHEQGPSTSTSQFVEKVSDQGDQPKKEDSYDNYQKLITMEENYAMSIDINQYTDMFLAECHRVKRIIFSMGKLKCSEGFTPELPEFENYLREVTLMLTHLRRMNRIIKLRGHLAKREASRLKDEIDADQLDLQNVVYELNYYKNKLDQTLKQTQALSHGSIDELNIMGQDILQKPLSDLSFHEHILFIRQLEDEYLQRVYLEKAVKQAERERDLALKELNARKEQFATCNALAADVLKAMSQVRGFMDAKEDPNPNTTYVKLFETIPIPLFILYTFLEAHQNSALSSQGGFSEVRLHGDQKEAENVTLALNKRRAALRLPSPPPRVVTTLDDLEQIEKNDNAKSNDDKSDSELESDDNGDDIDIDMDPLVRGLGLPMQEQQMETEEQPTNRSETKDDFLVSFPICIEWNMGTTDRQKSIKLAFYYLHKLDLMTVKVEMNVGDESESKFTAETILKNLFCDNDSGEISPNPSTMFLIPLSAVPELIEKFGRPYFWLQKLAGLSFPMVARFFAKLNVPSHTITVDGAASRIFQRMMMMGNSEI